MRPRCVSRTVQLLCALVLASSMLRANPGDVDNSQDYPGFPRQPGFIITDYDEDNPAESDFPFSRPLPLDADHLENIRIKGHRFVIRYELSGGQAPTVYQTQRYYEKLAANAGYQVAKSGAVGDVTETFCRAMSNHDIWVYLEPSNNVNVLTIVEAAKGSTPLTPAAPRLVVEPARVPVIAAPEAPPPKTIVVPPPAPVVKVAPAPMPAVAPVPATSPPPPALAMVDPDGESLFTSLSQQGRIVVPFVFQPGKDDLDASSQPLVDRIAAMMKRHPDLFLRIEGHTDNSGDPEDNLRLSAQRAIAVQIKLVAANVQTKRLDAVGVGGLQPLADNATAEGREKNRRIELVIWKKYAHKPTSTGAG